MEQLLWTAFFQAQKSMLYPHVSDICCLNLHFWGHWRRWHKIASFSPSHRIVWRDHINLLSCQRIQSLSTHSMSIQEGIQKNQKQANGSLLWHHRALHYPSWTVCLFLPHPSLNCGLKESKQRKNINLKTWIIWPNQWQALTFKPIIFTCVFISLNVGRKKLFT